MNLSINIDNNVNICMPVRSQNTHIVWHIGKLPDISEGNGNKGYYMNHVVQRLVLSSIAGEIILKSRTLHYNVRFAFILNITKK